MISFKVPPDRLEEVENAYLNSLVPEMEKYQGFAFALVFRNKDTNETYEVSIWEGEEALREERERRSSESHAATATDAAGGDGHAEACSGAHAHLVVQVVLEARRLAG